MKLQQYHRFLTVAGVPVYVHWSLSTLLVLSALPVFLLAFVPSIGATCFILMLAIHELGHCIVAAGMRCKVHEIRLYPFHGLCVYELPATNTEDARIAFAGPVAQLLVAVTLLYYYETVQPESLYVQTVIAVLGSFALVMALLNLLPIAGFDGEKIWAARKHR